MTPQKKRLLSALLLLITSVIWGGSFILIKKSLVVYSVQQVAILRLSFAYVVLLPGAIFHLKKYFKSKGFALFIAGITGNLVPAFLFAQAQTQLASGITGVLNSLTPIFTLIIGVFLFQFKMQRLQLIGLLVGLAGSVGLSLVNKSGNLGSLNIYALLVILAASFYGFNVNYVKKHLSEVPSVSITGMALFFIGPILILLLFLTDFTTRFTTHPDALEALLYLAVLGIVNTAIALILFFKLLKMTSPVVASSVTYIIPVVALIIGFLDGEEIFPLHIAGMGLIIFGVYLVNRK